MHTTKIGTCSICGRKNTKLYSLRGYKDVCSKHMHQIHKYGHPLDDNPRTTKDFNDYVVEGDIAKFNVYNQRSEKVAEFMVDKSDIDLIKYKKWRLNSLGYIVTGNCTKTNPLTWLHRILLQPREDEVVDHIDGNPLNNCRSNLRICTQKENLCNKSFMSRNTSNYIGVTFDKKRNQWASEIRFNDKRIHLRRWHTIEEAICARYIAEKILFKQYQNTTEQKKKEEAMKDKISESQFLSIKGYVVAKLKNKNCV